MCRAWTVKRGNLFVASSWYGKMPLSDLTDDRGMKVLAEDISYAGGLTHLVRNMKATWRTWSIAFYVAIGSLYRIDRYVLDMLL